MESESGNWKWSLKVERGSETAKENHLQEDEEEEEQQHNKQQQQ